MTRRLGALSVLVCVLLVAPASARLGRVQASAVTRAMELPDILAWKSMAATVLSPDGRWFAYRASPVQGDSDVVVRATSGDKEYRFSIGEVPAGGGGGEGAGQGAAQFSDDGRWAAFTVYPARSEAAKLKKQQKPLHNKLRLLDLSSGHDLVVDNVRRFAFAGERGGWIAIHRDPPDPPAGQRDKDKPKGSDLVLRDLATGRELNVGNVGEFAFDKPGRFLAWTIDAADQSGNGVVVRHMESGVVTPLDSDRAFYEKLSWTDAGNGLAVLKGVDDKAYSDRPYTVVAFRKLSDPTIDRVVFDPKTVAAFPADMSVSPDRAPAWTDDLADLRFGIRPLRKKPAEEKTSDEAAKEGGTADRNGAAGSADDKADLVIWHWKDPRLQSQQQVEEDRDRKFSFLCAYDVARKTFVRLADDDVREVRTADSGDWGVGLDSRAYDLESSLDGRRYQDVYAVNLKTGQRTLAAKHVRWFFGLSPAGDAFLYYENGQYFAYDMASGKAANLTAAVPASFVNTEDDHNVSKPPVPPIGWAKGGGAVLLSDGWDIWKVAVPGGAATNLTVNGRKDAIRYRSRFRLDPDEKGIDLDAPQYVEMYGEWTKKRGVARLVPGRAGAEVLAFDAASYGRLLKARAADTFVFTRETTIDPPEAFAAGADLKDGRRLTDFGAQRAAFSWTPGARLVDYTSAKGDRLQGALYLPAGYEAGRSYPTIVYIYEKLSQDLNRFAAPTANGFNRTVYTSNGYAVLTPDITYRVNDPGNSAVWCVLPALKAAIATGVVDAAHVGLHGHSWGGYQTAFLVTQTTAFAAAIAGAPLTDMVSMYSLIYKNTGSANQPIFESSQGRFLGGYWDNWDAYVRNSPIAFARNVRTPLVILHNDKDGAVDFTQGVEYFNTLRRLGKPVVLLEYLGENHGLRKPANQQDYTVRMKEFFGHYLKGEPAPAWLTDGVPRLEMDDHLKERTATKSGPAPAAKKQ